MGGGAEYLDVAMDGIMLRLLLLTAISPTDTRYSLVMGSGLVLPLELQRDIFTRAAQMHPHEIPARPFSASLAAVARVDGGAPYSRAIIDATKSKPPSFFQDAVRHLLLTVDSTSVLLDEVLELCTGVVDLVLFGPRLSVSLEELFGDPSAVDLTHPLFASITHLDIADDVDEATEICENIPALPALTHFCLNNEVSWDLVETLPAECPRLELLINLWHEDSATLAQEHAKDAPVNDVRFVVGGPADTWADWEASAKGLPNFWMVAEDFVERKRSGAIEVRTDEWSVAECHWMRDKSAKLL
ncbi:hypothetical protein FB451DRAFT_1178805 [Mycena latifolia]|nr:hypothetical protein FB451DRAFT_1178805 [Mycena latifolia]